MEFSCHPLSHRHLPFEFFIGEESEAEDQTCDKTEAVGGKVDSIQVSCEVGFAKDDQGGSEEVESCILGMNILIKGNSRGKWILDLT